MSPLTRRFYAACAAIPSLGGPMAVQADPIQQGLGDTFLAFEAEKDGVISNGTVQSFIVLSDAAASGGLALQVVNPTDPIFNEGGADGTTATSFVNYTLNFVNPGTYMLYNTVRTAPATLALDINAGDSFFFASVFGGPVDTRSISNNTADLTSYTFFSEIQTFTVGTPGSFTFTLGDREAGTIIDRFVFSSVTIPDKAAFDSIPNSIPEPSSCALLALVGAAVAARRNRRK